MAKPHVRDFLERFVKPLVLGDRVYLTSCASDEGPSRLEAFSVTHEAAE